jgi:hypothetical protein
MTNIAASAYNLVKPEQETCPVSLGVVTQNSANGITWKMSTKTIHRLLQPRSAVSPLHRDVPFKHFCAPSDGMNMSLNTDIIGGELNPHLVLNLRHSDAAVGQTRK